MPVIGRVLCRGKWSEQGLALIGSYMVLALFLVYSNAVTMRTVSQRLAEDRLRDRLQALDLAQGALEQVREDLHDFLTVRIYQQLHQGNAVEALRWLDDLGAQAEAPVFDLDGDAERDGTEGHPLRIRLPTGAAEARIVSIASEDSTNPLAPRRLTLEAWARVGALTKRLRAVYQIELGISDIFRYAYFINNLGWFDIEGDASLLINGEVRSNGDLQFDGNMEHLEVNGDLYASDNPELFDLQSGQPMEGEVAGDPTQFADLTTYWNWKGHNRSWESSFRARPARELTFPNQPAVGGDPKTLSYGMGWDSSHPEQRRFEGQPTHDIPYLGDLRLYKELAQARGGTLTYYDSGAGVWKTVNAIHPSAEPLVLIGTSSRPIQLSGPVVTQGDVIIKGYVSGRGTIYAGRNVHIVGDVVYKDAPTWMALDRDANSGRIRRHDGEFLGTVCTNGTYVPEGGSVPPGCI